MWKNTNVPLRINLFASIAPIALLIMVVGLFWVVAPMAIGRSLAVWELILSVVILVDMALAPAAPEATGAGGIARFCTLVNESRLCRP